MPAKPHESNRLLNYRPLGVRGDSINVENRTVDVLLSTETPVPTFDWERWDFVPEVLRNDGAEWPEQIPFLDSHDRSSVQRQLGSLRNIKKTSDGIMARAHFSAVEDAAFTKVREGHITDVSVGYQVLEKTFIPAGERQKVRGVEYEGPVNVATRWKAFEGSATPIGADQQAKIRGLAWRAPLQKGTFKMNEELRALFVAQGMPATLTDEEAVRWGKENMAKREPSAKADPPPAIVPPVDQAAVIRKAIADERERERVERLAFRKEVNDLAKIARVEVRAEWYDLPTRVEVVAEIHKEQAKRDAAPLGTMPRFADVQPQDRLRAAAGTALTLRAMRASGGKKETIDAIFPDSERDKNAGDFRNATMFDIARECVEADGINTRNMTRENIAKAALGFYAQAGVRAAGSAYHVTGSFPNLTLDAMNKSMMVGYTEAPSTWEGPMRQGASVPDFKTVNRLRMGAIPNLPVWPDNTDPEVASFKDAKETYAVEARALEIGFSWRLLVNDDMDSLSRAPQQMGNGARRTVNAFAWSLVTSNPTMSDSVALFAAATGNRKRTNLTTGAGAPSVATVQTLTNLMMQMRGENTPEEAESADILALQPAFIIGPGALRTTILQLVNSIADPAGTNSITFNTTRNLVPLIEPLLDVDSTTAWYLFASPSQIDTVEISFLQGQETPFTHNWMDDRTLSQMYTIVQTFGGAPLNHRGVQKHAGA